MIRTLRRRLQTRIVREPSLGKFYFFARTFSAKTRRGFQEVRKYGETETV